MTPAPPIVVVFFLHAISQGGLFTRLPDMQQALGLGEATLGLALFPAHYIGRGAAGDRPASEMPRR